MALVVALADDSVVGGSIASDVTSSDKSLSNLHILGKYAKQKTNELQTTASKTKQRRPPDSDKGIMQILCIFRKKSNIWYFQIFGILVVSFRPSHV